MCGGWGWGGVGGGGEGVSGCEQGRGGGQAAFSHQGGGPRTFCQLWRQAARTWQRAHTTLSSTTCPPPQVDIGAEWDALLPIDEEQWQEVGDSLAPGTRLQLRIHRVRHSYRPGEPVLPWIYAIARRVRVDHYRRSRRDREVAIEASPDMFASAQSPEPQLVFDALVATLPLSQREVVTLLKVGELSVEEVAGATASTVGAVKQKAHRAYRSLRKLLEKGDSPGRRAGGA